MEVQRKNSAKTRLIKDKKLKRFTLYSNEQIFRIASRLFTVKSMKDIRMKLAGSR